MVGYCGNPAIRKYITEEIWRWPPRDRLVWRGRQSPKLAILLIDLRGLPLIRLSRDIRPKSSPSIPWSRDVTVDIASELREHFAGYDDEPDSLEH